MSLTSNVSRVAGLAIYLACVGCSDRVLRTVDGGAGPVDGGAGDAGPGSAVDAGSCLADARYCDGLDLVQCGADGVPEALVEACADRCDAELGCIRCFPGRGRCEGGVSFRCALDGQSFHRIRDCAASGVACGPGGFCEDACGDAERTESNLGCRFLAVPVLKIAGRLDGLEQFSVSVSNTSPTEPARVTVRRGGAEVASATVAPETSEELVFDVIDEMTLRLGPAGRGPWESFVTDDGAFEVVSDVPVTVVQTLGVGDGASPRRRRSCPTTRSPAGTG